MAIIGAESACAVAIPVRRFVAPGPEVAKHTPGFLLTLPYPSAICAADCSCRAKMCLMLLLKSSSYIGRFAPPGKPKTSFTPSFSKDFMRALPPFIFSIILFTKQYLYNICERILSAVGYIWALLATLYLKC